MADRGDDAVMWASGGSWEPPPEPASVRLPAAPVAPVPGQKPEGRYGPAERKGAVGLVVGRFLPLHRGHQYLIDFAAASVERLHVLVFVAADDPISGDRRVAWIRAQFPGVEVAAMSSAVRPGSADFHAKFAALITPRVGRVTHFFSSELPYREAAQALGAQFVPVDPQRQAVPISGSAIRHNVMEHFHFLAPVTRPWFVRRVAVVGAESTGKTTLCARLREALDALVVPEWTRVLVESGHGALTSDLVQLAARSQIAAEDALARQATSARGGLLVCDTELRTITTWCERLFAGEPNAWIEDEIRARPYDLYLLCAPDIPFIGAPAWDQPSERARHHERLSRALAGRPVVELCGTREERFRTAADAIVGLFTPSQLFSARGAVM